MPPTPRTSATGKASRWIAARAAGSNRPATAEPRTQAQRCAAIDAMLGDPDDCDPRGRFIKRTELAEDTWDEYRTEYLASFERRCKAARRDAAFACGSQR